MEVGAGFIDSLEGQRDKQKKRNSLASVQPPTDQTNDESMHSSRFESAPRQKLLEILPKT